MYGGQLIELKQRMKRQDFEGVHVAAVDDFQGEQNRIIILSLVRSNSDNNIGFLAIENRVCVSLSRAKEGLYIVGNGIMLKDMHGTKWPKIIEYLEREKCFGRGLPIYCRNHPKDHDVMIKPEDFTKRLEGGCLKLCAMKLSCGHTCPRVCHIKDLEHKFDRCTLICNTQFKCGHVCKRRCFECKKNSNCMPCSEYVEKELPQYHHKVTVACSAVLKLISCLIACSEILDCGHNCQNMCSAPCTTKCKEKVMKQLPCGHQTKLTCFEDPQLALCPVKCDILLECGDHCTGTCGKCKQGHLHIKCIRKCGCDLICGHTCDFSCASVCPPCNKPCNNFCIHSKCLKKCYQPCAQCLEQCEWRCDHFKCSKPCGELYDHPPCNKPCTKFLPCHHKCIGLCGERCPKKCRICHKDEIHEIFFGTEDDLDAFIELQDCGHIFEVTGLDRWMATDNNEVMFKSCPKCKTMIRKSVRYGNHIKRTLLDVDSIKLKYVQDRTDIYVCQETATEKINFLKNKSFIQVDMDHIKEFIESTSERSTILVQLLLNFNFPYCQKCCS